MKKQYSRKLRYSSGDEAIKSGMLAFGLIIAIAAIFALLKVFAPAVIVALAEPFWKLGSTLDTGVGADSANFQNAKVLAQENAQLAQQVATLQNENSVLTARSQDLTKLLGGQAQVADGGAGEILAGVLARPPLSPYDTLIVGVGSGDGVVVGAEVFAEGGIPIGTVQSITSHSAIIELFSMSGMTTNAWVGENRTPLTLTGMGAGAFTSTLPRAAAVTVGDSVYVSGPGALPIGTILQVQTDPSSPTEVLSIQPLVNIFSTTWVEIARSAN